MTSLIFMPNISVGDVLATRYSLPSESGEAGWQLPATRSRWLLWGPSSSSWAWWASWPGPPRTRLVGQWPELDNFSLNSQCVVIKLCCEWYISLKVPQRWSSFIKDLDNFFGNRGGGQPKVKLFKISYSYYCLSGWITPSLPEVISGGGSIFSILKNSRS